MAADLVLDLGPRPTGDPPRHIRPGTTSYASSQALANLRPVHKYRVRGEKNRRPVCDWMIMILTGEFELLIYTVPKNYIVIESPFELAEAPTDIHIVCVVFRMHQFNRSTQQVNRT